MTRCPFGRVYKSSTNSYDSLKNFSNIQKQNYRQIMSSSLAAASRISCRRIGASKYRTFLNSDCLSTKSVSSSATASSSTNLNTVCYNSSDKNCDDKHLTLFQYAICPFCNKAKTALRYLNIPFETKEVNPLTRSEVKGLLKDETNPEKDYTKVPIARLNDGSNRVVKESGDIVILAAEEAARRDSNFDKEHFLSPDAKKWHDWCDNEFAVCMYPNITRNLSECYSALSYVHNTFSKPAAVAIQLLGSVGMSFAHGKILKKRGIEKGGERAALYMKVQEWETELKRVGSSENSENSESTIVFRGGEKPDLSDVSVFGCVRGLKELPVYDELKERDVFGGWMRKMEEKV